MFGDKVLVGYSSCSLDSKNRIHLPKFTCCEAGERLLIIPEDDNLAIYSSKTLDVYVERINSIKNVEDQKELLKEFRKYCESVIQETTVDNQNRITLTTNIDFIERTIELRGSGDRLVLSGNFNYPSLYRKRV